MTPSEEDYAYDLIQEAAEFICGMDPDKLSHEFFINQDRGKLALKLLNALGKPPKLYQAWLEKQR